MRVRSSVGLPVVGELVRPLALRYLRVSGTGGVSALGRCRAVLRPFDGAKDRQVRMNGRTVGSRGRRWARRVALRWLCCGDDAYWREDEEVWRGLVNVGPARVTERRGVLMCVREICDRQAPADLEYAGDFANGLRALGLVADVVQNQA